MDWFPIITGAVAVFVAVAALYRASRNDAGDELDAKICASIKSSLIPVNEKLIRIELQVNPNSGGSMRDEIKRIEIVVARIDERTESNSDRLKHVEGDMDRLETNCAARARH